MVRKIITLESCGNPTCPLSDRANLEKIFQDLQAQDICSTASCPFNMPQQPQEQQVCGAPYQKDEIVCRRVQVADEAVSAEISTTYTSEKTSISPKTISTTETSPTEKNEPPPPEKTEADQEPPSPPSKRRPCKKSTCRKMRRCPDCGGVTVSGATCSNPNVPYDPNARSITPEPSVDEEEEARKEKQKEEQKKKEAAREAARLAAEKLKHSIKRKTRFVYKGGKRYPGVRLGHKVCFQSTRNVPKHMGWLWTAPAEGRLKVK